MGIKIADYKVIRKEMQPGDVIAFSGKGNVSDIIKWATRSQVSHVGIVFESKVVLDDTAQKGIIVDVMESTTLQLKKEASKAISGVQRNRLSDHITYYNGNIWWLPLKSTIRSKMNMVALTDFLLHSENKEYDVPQAIMSAIDVLDKTPLLGSLTCNVEDFSKFFCSELVAAALEAGNAIKSLNASEVTPIDLCMFSIYENDYYQIKGKETKIAGYNTTSPEGFGEYK